MSSLFKNADEVVHPEVPVPYLCHIGVTSRLIQISTRGSSHRKMQNAERPKSTHTAGINH